MFPASTEQRLSNAFDFTSILHASQAISGEIHLDKLLTKLMTLMIENAGRREVFFSSKKKDIWSSKPKRRLTAAKYKPAICSSGNVEGIAACDSSLRRKNERAGRLDDATKEASIRN